jgi:hypothetical protein
VLTTRFVPNSVLVNTAGGTDLWINQIQSTSPDQRVTLIKESGGSQTDVEYIAIKTTEPMVPIVTTDLTNLATIGMAGIAVAPGSGTPGVVIYGRETPLESLPAAITSGVHLTMAVSDGMLIPETLEASNNESAKLTLMLHAILGSTATYSGATPLVTTAAQQIPSGAGVTANIFTTGVVKYTISGGSSYLVYGIMRQSVKFGITLFKEWDSGEAHPTYIAIKHREPVLTFTTADLTQAANIGEGVSVSSCAFYFRAMSQNGQRVAQATTSHVSIIGTEGILKPAPVDQKYGNSSTASFEFHPSINTNLLTISTSAAIPTS